MPDLRGDADLLALARTGDHAAWSELARRHAPRLAAYLGARLRRLDIIDHLVGETVVAAWLRLGEVGEAEGFAAWFRKTGAGLALKWAREHPAEPIEAPLPPGRLPADRAADLARLDRLIGGLDEMKRMALELRWRGGLDGEGLAAALRTTPEQAVRLVAEAESELSRAWDGG